MFNPHLRSGGIVDSFKIKICQFAEFDPTIARKVEAGKKGLPQILALIRGRVNFLDGR